MFGAQQGKCGGRATRTEAPGLTHLCLVNLHLSVDGPLQGRIHRHALKVGTHLGACVIVGLEWAGAGVGVGSGCSGTNGAGPLNGVTGGQRCHLGRKHTCIFL